MKKTALLASAAIAALLSVSTAQSATIAISVGSGWHEFGFGGVGSSWDNTFTFTLASTATFRVTDAFLSGDRFRVDQILPVAVVLGLTSVPGSLGDSIGSDFDGAFADARWSSGSFLLGPGSYEIGGIAVDSPFGGGGAAVSLVAGGVPEPATWLMMLMGFAGLGYAARRRQETATA